MADINDHFPRPLDFLPQPLSCYRFWLVRICDQWVLKFHNGVDPSQPPRAVAHLRSTEHTSLCGGVGQLLPATRRRLRIGAICMQEEILEMFDRTMNADTYTV